MHIAAVTAHPDDIEIMCAGTLAKYIKKGHKVTFIVATNGEAGAPAVSEEDFKKIIGGEKINTFEKLPGKNVISKEDIAAIRHDEAKEGAKIIGADLIWLGYPDEFLFDNKETRLAI